jgi:hypothetical protein
MQINGPFHLLRTARSACRPQAIISFNSGIANSLAMCDSSGGGQYRELEAITGVVFS